MGTALGAGRSLARIYQSLSHRAAKHARTLVIRPGGQHRAITPTASFTAHLRTSVTCFVVSLTRGGDIHRVFDLPLSWRIRRPPTVNNCYHGRERSHGSKRRVRGRPCHGSSPRPIRHRRRHNPAQLPQIIGFFRPFSPSSLSHKTLLRAKRKSGRQSKKFRCASAPAWSSKSAES